MELLNTLSIYLVFALGVGLVVSRAGRRPQPVEQLQPVPVRVQERK